MTNKIMKYSPLTEATFYILLSLEKPIHGYGIIKKVESMTNGRLNLVAGTLYGVISKLLKADLIELLSEEKLNKNKKMYISTESGKQLIRYEIKRLKEMIKNSSLEVSDK